MTLPLWFQETVAIASGILTIVGCLLLLSVLVGMIVAWRGMRSLGAPLAAAQRDLKPLAESLRRTASQFESVAGTIRQDVENVHETVSTANVGLRSLVEGVEVRVRRLDAAVGVVQDELEDAITAAAAAARGVRAGATVLRDALTSSGGQARARGAGQASDELSGPDADAEAENLLTNHAGDLGDGDQNGRDRHAGGQRPRARSRQRAT